ncbi:MAG: M23 family metallopeptidase [Deltaproteobacteria bacterium]|nr:MAG: M23 family metallopeptidase [Deltaproteobacteria bacterium]
MVVPDRHATVRKYRVPKSLLRLTAVVAVVVLCLLVLGTVHYFQLLGDAAEAAALREENLQLRTELMGVQEKVAHLGATLERVERLDSKLRMLTQLNDPERNLAIGPTDSEGSAAAITGGDAARLVADVPPPLDTEGMSVDEVIELINMKLDTLSADARREETSLHELSEYFHDQKALLGAMPAIWPARGWVTSNFGMREDPFTGARRMHAGIDIAAQPGTPVHAPADGTVIYSGHEAGYGNLVIIDHGYGVQTFYGHLLESFVRAGQKVKRGDKIAAIGNTGRSTGPHLHYEVRVDGIPQKPTKFILD